MPEIRLCQRCAWIPPLITTKFRGREDFDGTPCCRDHGSIGVSKPREFHPQLLAEPGVNLSTHRAPIVPTVNGLRFCLAHALILPEELAHVWTGTTRPLRSTLITSASTLIRVGPPSRCASILSTLLFFAWSFLLASQPEFPQFHGCARIELTPPLRRTSPTQSAGSPMDSSQGYAWPLVLMSSTRFRRLNGGSLVLVFSIRT